MDKATWFLGFNTFLEAWEIYSDQVKIASITEKKLWGEFKSSTADQIQ